MGKALSIFSALVFVASAIAAEQNCAGLVHGCAKPQQQTMQSDHCKKAAKAVVSAEAKSCDCAHFEVIPADLGDNKRSGSDTAIATFTPSRADEHSADKGIAVEIFNALAPPRPQRYYILNNSLLL